MSKTFFLGNDVLNIFSSNDCFEKTQIKVGKFCGILIEIFQNCEFKVSKEYYKFSYYFKEFLEKC